MRQNVIKAEATAAEGQQRAHVWRWSKEQGNSETKKKPKSHQPINLSTHWPSLMGKCRRVTYLTLLLMWHVQRAPRILQRTHVPDSTQLNSVLDSIPCSVPIPGIPACVNCVAVLQAAVNWPLVSRAAGRDKERERVREQERESEREGATHPSSIPPLYVQCSCYEPKAKLE